MVIYFLIVRVVVMVLLIARMVITARQVLGFASCGWAAKL